MLNRHFPRRQPAICLSGPTNTVDAGQISSFPAVFQPPASKANRKGDWITLPGGRWRVCIRRGAEYAPRGLESPSDASRLLQCLAPACLHCVCVDPIPATIAIITAWGRASLFFASVTQTLCTLLPAFCNDSLSRDTPKTVCGKPPTCMCASSILH